MTYEQQHCESCTCYQPKVMFNEDGTVTLLNGATMPACDGCGYGLYAPGANVYYAGGKSYHDNGWCRP